MEECTDIVPITDCIVEQHDGWERPPTPEMMPLRYDKWDGFSPQEIEDKLRQENYTLDPNTVREEQIEQLEMLMTGLDFWPEATEIFQKQQSILAAEIDYTGVRRKHKRRDLDTILQACHAEVQEEIRNTKRVE